jgi:hypothetical protein
MTDEELAKAMRQTYFNTLYGYNVRISDSGERWWLPVAKKARELLMDDTYYMSDDEVDLLNDVLMNSVKVVDDA